MTVIAHARRNATQSKAQAEEVREAPRRATSSLPYLWHVNVAAAGPLSKEGFSAVSAKYEKSFLHCPQPTYLSLSLSCIHCAANDDIPPRKCPCQATTAEERQGETQGIETDADVVVGGREKGYLNAAARARRLLSARGDD